MLKRTVVTSGPGATQRLGSRLAEYLAPGDIIPLIGDMGTGKTCFVQGIARGLNVPHDLPVSSPSFTLANRYPGRIPLYHVDLFRLDRSDQLIDIELEELLHGDGATLIEWPQIAWDLLANVPMTVEFTWDMVRENERQIIFSTENARFEAFVRTLRK